MIAIAPKLQHQRPGLPLTCALPICWNFGLQTWNAHLVDASHFRSNRTNKTA